MSCSLTGVGWGMLVINLISNTYFVMIIAYGIYYLFASFSSTLPWSNCHNAWNTDSKCPGAIPPIRIKVSQKNVYKYLKVVLTLLFYNH